MDLELVSRAYVANVHLTSHVTHVNRKKLARDCREVSRMRNVDTSLVVHIIG